MTTECPTCGRSDFASDQGMRTHHAISHGEKLLERLTCEYCGDEYERWPSEAENSKYCSKSCLDSAKSERTGEKNPLFEGKVLTCEECSAKYTRCKSKASNSKYCSWECQYSGRTNLINIVCETCGDNYKVQKCRRSSRFCSMECMYEWKRNRPSKEHPLYEGWSGNHYQTYDWREWTKRYRSWVGECEYCGDDENLQTHHIEPISMGGDMWDNDFVVLCTDCHYGDYERWHPPQLEDYID